MVTGNLRVSLRTVGQKQTPGVMGHSWTWFNGYRTTLDRRGHPRRKLKREFQHRTARRPKPIREGRGYADCIRRTERRRSIHLLLRRDTASTADGARATLALKGRFIHQTSACGHAPCIAYLRARGCASTSTLATVVASEAKLGSIKTPGITMGYNNDRKIILKYFVGIAQNSLQKAVKVSSSVHFTLVVYHLK